MRATRVLTGAAALFLSLFATRAQATPLQLDLGVFGGWHYFSTTNQLGIDVGNTNPDLKLSQSGTFGLRVGFIVHPYVSLEAELGLTPTGATIATGDAKALAVNYRAHLLVHVLKGKIRPFILAGGGGTTLSSSNPDVLHEDTDGEFHFGVGSKFDIQRNWGIRLDARLYVVPTTNADKIYATNDFEVTLGFYGLFGGAHERPRMAAPPPPPNPDRDGDGVPNAEDLCPDEKGVPENRGCPDKDSDGDLIVDRLDKCPNDKGPPENGGCPDTDTDKDGVPDRLDKCPNEPETVNGYQDLDGCPDELPKEVKKFTGAVKGINFENGKATLLPSSNKVLDEVVGVLKSYPDVKIEIQGHTDNNGDRNKNIDLSKARAEAVRQYLLAHGTAEARITSIGFGPDKPVADNKSSSGRAKNRRVEFKLIN